MVVIRLIKRVFWHFVFAFIVVYLIGSIKVEASTFDYDFDTPTTGSSLTEWTDVYSGCAYPAFSLKTDTTRTSPNSIMTCSPQSVGSGSQYRITGKEIDFATTTQAKIDFFWYTSTSTYSSTVVPLSIATQNFFGVKSATGEMLLFGLGINGGLNILPVTNAGSDGWTTNPQNTDVFYPSILDTGWNHVTLFYTDGNLDIIINDEAVPTITMTYTEFTSFVAMSSVYGTADSYGGLYSIKSLNRLDDLNIYTGTDTPTEEGVVVSSEYQTRFTGVDFSYSSSTQQLSIDSSYFLDITEIDETIPAKYPSMVKVRWAETSTTNYFSIADNITIEDGNGTSTQTVSDITDGVYIFEISFTNLPYQISQDLNKKPFPRTYMLFEIEIVDGEIVAQNVDVPYTGQEPESISTECGITNITGCITNAFYALVIPNSFSVQQIKNLNDTLATKFPFAYLYDFQTSVTTLYSSSQTSSSSISFNFAELGELTLISQEIVSQVPFANWIKITLGYILWFMFGMLMYHRTLRIFNQNPQ